MLPSSAAACALPPERHRHALAEPALPCRLRLDIDASTMQASVEVISRKLTHLVVSN